MTAFHALLVAITLAFLPFSMCDTFINSISPSYGSTAGGTRLSIYGSGFGDMYSEMAVVYVGSFPCSVIMHLSSSEVLTCETSSGLAGTYFVAVSVGGQDPVTYYGFTYAGSYTPTFKTAYPYAGPPGTTVQIYGDTTWQLQYSDCPAKTWGDVDCVGAVIFGDYLCRQDPSANGTGITFTYGTQRYGYNMYIIGCTLPTPDIKNNQPEVGTANNLNISIHFEASMRGGMPSALRYSYHFTADGTPYQFQMYPEVTGVSPALGSNAGGTLLRISGSGFPDLGLDLGDIVNVSISGVPCSVVNSTYDSIFCITGSRPAQPSLTSTPVNGLYPGMRGVEYEFYNTTQTILPGYKDMWKLNKTILLNNTPGSGSYRTVLTGAMESIHYEISYHCTRLKAFFIAPRTANYTFYLDADDYGQLNGTYVNQTSGVVVNKTLIGLMGWTPLDSFFTRSEQKSLPVALMSGQPILLESAHCNGGSIGVQQVAVRMQVPKPQANSMAEQQIISVGSILVPRSLAIKYMYGAGATTTAFTVNVTSTDDSKLDSESLGLELTLNNINGNQVVVLPLLATGLEMTALIEAAFGGSCSMGSNNTSFGVYKARIPGLLTVQVGIDSNIACGQDFTVTLARLVVMPSAAPYISQSCGQATSNQTAAARRLLATTIDVNSATAGMLVILERARPVAAVAPGGFFQLRLADDSDAIVLPYDTNNTIMSSAIFNLTALSNTVALTSVRREGTFLARVWNVTFGISALNTVPDVVAETNERTPEGVVSDVEVRAANPPVTGSFWIAFGSNCGSVEIMVTDVSQTISSKLASLPGMTAPQSVVVSGGPAYGYKYTITFDPIGNPGDQPPLRVTDISGLRGIGPNASVATATDGTTDAFYAPIPTEFLRLAVAQPGTISLEVNGVPSACADASGICGFMYSDAATPHITSVAPTTLQFSSQSSLPLTITGSDFNGNSSLLEVRVGTALCNVTSATATQIICDVPDTAPAGIRLVTVNVAGLGFADGAPNITLETLFVTGSDPSSPVLASTGVTVLNFTGKGFDYINCANNEFSIASVPCGVIDCGVHFLTVAYPGNGGTEVAAANVTAQVYENGREIDRDTPSSVRVQIAGSAPSIVGLSPSSMPGCGGVVTLSLSGATASQVTSVFMVPYISSLVNYTEASAAFQARMPCTNVTATASDTVTCVSPALRNGRYHTLAILSSGLQLLSTNSILFELFITSVSPNLGSIGGGTVVTITGSGFSPDVTSNAVFMTVPVSSTFLNGIIECVTESVTTTTLTCRTLPSMAADADVNDPKALNVMPVATQPRQVSVVLCDPSYNTTILRGYCWSLPETPRANCAASDPSLCSFGYATDLTPYVQSISPTRGYYGDSMSVSGTYMEDVMVVQFLQNGVVKDAGTDVSAGDGGVTCSVPDLLPGVYTILLLKANGEMSVDPYKVGIFTYYATITGLEDAVGSLAGGLPLSITVGGAGLAANATENQVTIAGLPCPILSVENRTHLTCRAPGINGYVYAEYWNLGYNTKSVPDLISFTQPLLARLEKGLDLSWKSSSPLPGTIQADYFAARYTFYYQIEQTEDAVFKINADDEARLYVDGELIGSQGMYLNVSLAAGVHKIVTTFVEYTGLASVQLQVALSYANGTIGTFSVVEWQKVTPILPGSALPVTLTASSVDSDLLCPSSTKVLQLPGQPILSWEPSEVMVPIGTCGYIYSTYRTPSLSVVKSVTLSGITLPTFVAPNSTMNIYGNFLVDPSSPLATSQVTITLANQSCNIISITATTYNGANVTNIACTAPFLPAGQWPVSIMVRGLGLTRPTATAATDLPIVAYNVKVLSYISPPSATTNKCYFSMFGGGTFNISGYGFVKGLVDSNLQVNMTAAWETPGPCSVSYANTPLCQAANSSRVSIVPLACDGSTALFGLGRIKVPNPEAYAANSSFSSIYVKYKPRVYYTNNGTYAATTGSEALYVCGGRTPALSGVSPPSSSSAPNASADLTLTWYLSAVGSQNNFITAPTANGVPSNATVEFEVGPTLLSCANPVITSYAITTTTYREAISCKMPAYMPAATYTLWLCIQPFGCGLVPAYNIPLTVSAISAITGSSAGGITVVITGNGFDTNATRVSARFGNSTCKITSSTATSVTCITGPLDSKPASAVSFPLSITPTLGTSEITLSSFSFTFDPALESAVTNIAPARGSTEGGTPITITGADFSTGVSTTVTIGETPCSSVVVVNSTTITCTTGKPPSNILRIPLPVTVLQQGRGYARSSVQYQYIDVWSRNTTWGGGPLPGYEDSVVIPAGVTVLLDISPPKLFIIVLEGNLIFDDTKDYLNLQAHYIIVMGGNFTIGSEWKPYPGRANITMHGLPNSRDLPQYGAKALAVRDGVVTFFGQPKIPHYTKLNRTVDAGETSIVVNGALNWQVGDRIVIASSSFYAYEVDEATITALDKTTTPGCTVITLDAPLNYTHLGEIHLQDGVKASLDMRAEVAVLTRNIVLQGDYTSAQYQYGVQVMVNSPKYLPRALVRFDNVEITQSGQAFRLGRYSMHWHMHGDVAYQSWLRGCAIHHTYNRATTIHGTHRTILQNNVAYKTMGHTFFLEDGIESGNLIEGNIAIYVRVSDALLNTDTTPAAFWITNPNNTVRNNVAAGSAAYGYWYRMLDNPEGPSYTTTVCPKFTPLLEFTNNTAHSNMFYGLRIHPEFYPRNIPCNGFSGTFEQVPAVFNGLVAYKNGMKGAVGTQVGMVQLANVVAGDNGGGPKQHVVNGKDHGGDVELSWVVDDRSRVGLQVTEMAGLVNATLFSRTNIGRRGTAGQWPSCRRVAGVITQSPVQGDSKHSALMSLINVTFVDFKGWDGCTLFSAMEACGKCKTYQGGSTTFTANISFATSDGSKPLLSYWSWGHQGIFLDTDGTLLNDKSLPDSLLPDPSVNWTLGPGATWHSAVENQLFDPTECVHVNDMPSSNDGAYCSPALTFRRVMLHGHTPDSLEFQDLLLTSEATNRTSVVHFTKYNELGYQFTVATGRDYWVHWNMPFRLDPDTYELHKMDLMSASDHVYITTKHIQVKDHFTINYNDRWNSLTAMPPPTNAAHGMFFYNKTMAPNSWWWSNRTYNDTKFTVFVDGRADSALDMHAFTCPAYGCKNVPETVVDVRNGTLYWSNASTWNTSMMNFHKPVAGDNVTIPYGWELVIDESPPPLLALTIQGNVRFDPTRDINLTATYIVVIGQGVLSAGNASVPHPTKATILLQGMRDTPDYGIDNDLNLGSKVLAALSGGTINLYGKPANKRWIKLGSEAKVGDNAITVSDPLHGWSIGDEVLVTSTSFNWKQSEMRTITAIRNNGSELLLDTALEHPHGALVKTYRNGPTVDMRAEVGLVSSNIIIKAVDGESTHSYNGEMFGARVVVSGNSTGRFDNMGMQYCGQSGFDERACMYFFRLAQVTTAIQSVTNVTTLVKTSNPSFIRSSVLLYGMASNVRIGDNAAADPIIMADNIMYEAYDAHSVAVYTKGNTIRGNLVIGTIKDMTGKSGFDVSMPSSFDILYASNWVTDNVAAGAERYGFAFYGPPCGNFMNGAFRNNTAHSCLAGLWLRASPEALSNGCTQLTNFTTYMNWDFGVISTRGISTDVVLKDVNILDTKHAGIHLMRMGDMLDKGWMRWEGGLLAGQSSDAVCSTCTKSTDPGCHQKLSRQSFNQHEPYTPAVGLQSSQFALSFATGPEQKPFDKPMGYSLIHGMFNITGITLADFLGPAGCSGPDAGTYALANHPKAPEFFYPHYFSKINVQNIGIGLNQGMFYHTPPDPDWRNEADCGEATYTRADGSQILLNCAGPAHAYWRDLDGSLTGTVSTTAGIFTSKRVFPMDQGSPVLPGACTYSPYWDSYQCVANSSSYVSENGLDPRYKPDPVPADGIWGDPQMLVLESRDKDSEDRNFSPVFFNVSGSIDVVTTAMDHGWCFAYTCQKRLSTFWTYVPTGQTVYINFTGTPSQSFRIWFPYADPGKEVVLVINMLYTLNRRFAWLPPGNGNTSGRVMPSDKPIRIGDGTPHGSYFWDQDNTLLYIKIMGGKSVETRTESAVMVSQSFAVTIDNFYAQKAVFLKNLASVMGIDMNRIYIAKVVAGSVDATIGLEPDKSIPVDTLPENNITTLVDPSEPVVTDPASSAAATGSGSSGGSSPSSPPPPPPAQTSSSAAVLDNLAAAYQSFVQAVTAPDAGDTLGFVPIGTPTADWSGVASATSPPPPPLAASSDPFPPPPSPASSSWTPPPGTSVSSPPPPASGSSATSPPPASGSSVTSPPPLPILSKGEGAVNNDGSPLSGSGTGMAAIGSGTNGGDNGLSTWSIVLIAFGACVFVGLVAVVVAIAKRLRPASPPGALSSSILPMPTGGSPGSGYARHAFVTTNPAYETPAERAAAARGRPGPMPVQESLDIPPTSPRSSVLAAGATPTSPPEVIRPLSTTARMPHSSLPLTPPPLPTVPMAGVDNVAGVAPSGAGNVAVAVSGGAAAATAATSAASSSSSRSPAQLAPGQVAPSRRSLDATMKYAPNVATSAADWAANSVEIEQLPEAGCNDVKGLAAVGDGSNPAGVVAPVTAGSIATAAAANGTPVQAINRTLDVSDSIAPRTRSPSAIGGSSNGIRAGADQLSGHPGEDGGQAAAMAPLGPSQVQQERPGSGRQTEQPPAIMLPGGMMEYAASASLLRSEAAAMVVAGGMGSPAATGPGDEPEGATVPKARTPAGLRSDSICHRELPEVADETE